MADKIPVAAAVIRNQEEFMIRKILVLAAVALAGVTSSVLTEQAQAGPGYHCTKYPNGRVHCN
ncbi:MAG TPA: hypothetical protein VE993_19455 [Stellaceae bacterium]|nr:hypothetical protein [Stellaceae bacterium]